MSQDALKPQERAVLLVLTALGTPVSNPQLKERFRFTIEKPVRLRLQQLKLISTATGPRRALYHEATSDGWGRAAEELPGELPVSLPGKAAAMLIAGQLHGYLARQDLRLLDIFVAASDDDAEPVPVAETPTKGADAPANGKTSVETRVRSAYRELATAPGSPVLLSRLRAQLADLPRKTLDDELRRLSKAQQINLIPESNRKGLSEADKAASLRLGRQNKHLIVIEVG
ncbi:hypothetical protein [Cryptosporangium phraense]|uniref:Uncharacterized protein n=1 Tax=Cryptosporangium phraense TaxID=2593070 RepID=A0A545AHS9_9ACTN|nr:hypothetical protein [Cryptosporangium phraense]TQS40871.1 hypothetical protein FL583_32845 [Cryptosporangium phraense]